LVVSESIERRIDELIERFHAASVCSAWAVTGGGLEAVARLLRVPGASATVREVSVPYAAEALAEYLGANPERACSAETARALAARAMDRASQSVGAAGEGRSAWGIGLTAALVSSRPKRGEHRAHWALQSPDVTLSATLVLEKGARSRAEEDAVVGRACLFTTLPFASGLPSWIPDQTIVASGFAGGIWDVELTARELPDVGLLPGEKVTLRVVPSCPRILELRRSGRPPVWYHGGRLVSESSRPPVRGLLSGSFNPLHEGHRGLQAVAQQRLGGPVGFELSIWNVAKPPLDDLTISERLAQFGEDTVVLSAAATFAEKATHFPSTVFVIGEDTFVRVLDPRFHGGDWEGVVTALESVRQNSCRFLVAGRVAGSQFVTLEDCGVPAEFADLFDGLTEAEFRIDRSSTELRRKRIPGEAGE
jgi:hypothetical protein